VHIISYVPAPVAAYGQMIFISTVTRTSLANEIIERRVESVPYVGTLVAHLMINSL